MEREGMQPNRMRAYWTFACNGMMRLADVEGLHGHSSQMKDEIEPEN